MWRLILIAIVLYLAYSMLRTCQMPTDYQVKQELREVGDKAANSEVGRTVKDAVRDVEELAK